MRMGRRHTSIGLVGLVGWLGWSAIVGSIAGSLDKSAGRLGPGEVIDMDKRGPFVFVVIVWKLRRQLSRRRPD